MEKETFYNLFSVCKVVKGPCRSLLIDVQRKLYWSIPNTMSDFILTLSAKSKTQLMRHYNEEDREVVNLYLEFLIKNDLIFECIDEQEMNCFPAMSEEWHNPFEITNAVVEFVCTDDLPEIVNFFSDQYIPFYQFIYYGKLQSLENLQSIVLQLEAFPLKCFQLLFNNFPKFDLRDLKDILKSFPRIEQIVAFNSDTNEVQEVGNALLIATTQAQFSHKYCGIVNEQYFIPTLEHFNEALQFNTCLNRKIAVDSKGYVRNCPSSLKDFGNISNISLQEVLQGEDFRSAWFLSKQKISICNVCEFRYICQDCRIYTQNPIDNYSKPLKCGYDPYTATWEDWTKSEVNQAAIRYYKMGDLAMDMNQVIFS